MWLSSSTTGSTIFDYYIVRPTYKDFTELVEENTSELKFKFEWSGENENQGQSSGPTRGTPVKKS